METHGYSGTPLDKKLGLKPGLTMCVLGETDAVLPAAPSGRPADVVLWFVRSYAELEEQLADSMAARAPKGSLWICWPKKASGVQTDVTEQSLRDVVLPTGLVDNKVCAIDATWSGLRFVERRSGK